MVGKWATGEATRYGRHRAMSEFGYNTIEPIIRLSRRARACHGHPWIAGLGREAHMGPAMTTEE